MRTGMNRKGPLCPRSDQTFTNHFDWNYGGQLSSVRIEAKTDGVIHFQWLFCRKDEPREKEQNRVARQSHDKLNQVFCTCQAKCDLFFHWDQIFSSQIRIHLFLFFIFLLVRDFCFFFFASVVCISFFCWMVKMALKLQHRCTMFTDNRVYSILLYSILLYFSCIFYHKERKWQIFFFKLTSPNSNFKTFRFAISSFIKSLFSISSNYTFNGSCTRKCKTNGQDKREEGNLRQWTCSKQENTLLLACLSCRENKPFEELGPLWCHKGHRPRQPPGVYPLSVVGLWRKRIEEKLHRGEKEKK